MSDVFEELSQMLSKLPEQIKEAYEEATIEAVNVCADKFEDDLRRMSGSTSLNANMITGAVERPHEYYERNVDWNDEKIVNVDKGKNYGQQAQKRRLSRKRNYSIRPATYHDLAYIINQGHGGVMGNRFIDRAKRRVKLQAEQEKLFNKKLDEIDNKGN